MTGEATGAAKQLTKQGLHRREHLLDVATQALIEVGNAKSSMRDIAERAEVRLGHLQYYFPTRGDLIRAVLERTMDRSLRRVAEVTAPAGDVADPFGVSPEQLVTVLLSEQSDPLLVRLYVEIWAIAAKDEAVAAVTRAFYQRYVGLVVDFIERCQPDLSERRRWGRARVFVGLLEGISVLGSEIADTGSCADDEELAEIAVQILKGRPRDGCSAHSQE